MLFDNWFDWLSMSDLIAFLPSFSVKTLCEPRAVLTIVKYRKWSQVKFNHLTVHHFNVSGQ